MKANELRIANYIDTNFASSDKSIESFRSSKVQEISEKGVKIQDKLIVHEYIAPILLTVEWLVALGLEPKDEEYFYLKNDDRQILIDIEAFDVWFDFREEGYHCAIKHDLKYVHRLQNLYFELNDKELEITK
ncbi:hypothetical protein [Pedobacter panaciterrae]